LQASVFTTPFVGSLLGICFEHPGNLIYSSTLIGGQLTQLFINHFGRE
jgi:hypothetical protein